MEDTQTTLLQRLFARRDDYRERARKGALKVAEEDAVLETNEHATMRWYVHPDFDHVVDRNTLVYRYEIEPHGETGLQSRQGNVVSFVVSGHGYTLMNGKKHAWKAGDVIGMPPLPNGVTFKHVNESDETAMLVTAEPNLFDALGVDMGASFEQLEPAPGRQQSD